MGRKDCSRTVPDPEQLRSLCAEEVSGGSANAFHEVDRFLDVEGQSFKVRTRGGDECAVGSGCCPAAQGRTGAVPPLVVLEGESPVDQRGHEPVGSGRGYVEGTGRVGDPEPAVLLQQQDQLQGTVYRVDGITGLLDDSNVLHSRILLEHCVFRHESSCLRQPLV